MGQHQCIAALRRHIRDLLPTSRLCFTRMPLDKTEADKGAVLGDYIGVHDIHSGVADGGTVPMYCRPLVKPELSGAARACARFLEPHVDRRKLRMTTTTGAADSISDAGEAMVNVGFIK